MPSVAARKLFVAGDDVIVRNKHMGIVPIFKYNTLNVLWNTNRNKIYSQHKTWINYKNN